MFRQQGQESTNADLIWVFFDVLRENGMGLFIFLGLIGVESSLKQSSSRFPETRGRSKILE
jgi:hypothetical protein